LHGEAALFDMIADDVELPPSIDPRRDALHNLDLSALHPPLKLKKKY